MTGAGTQHPLVIRWSRVPVPPALVTVTAYEEYKRGVLHAGPGGRDLIAPKSRVSQTTVFGAQRPMVRTLHRVSAG
jgi:hypothetical protein